MPQEIEVKVSGKTYVLSPIPDNLQARLIVPLIRGLRVFAGLSVNFFRFVNDFEAES